MYMSALPGALRGQKRTSDPQALMVMSCLLCGY